MLLLSTSKLNTEYKLKLKNVAFLVFLIGLISSFAIGAKASAELETGAGRSEYCQYVGGMQPGIEGSGVTMYFLAAQNTWAVMDDGRVLPLWDNSVWTRVNEDIPAPKGKWLGNLQLESGQKFYMLDGILVTEIGSDEPTSVLNYC